MIEYYSYYPFLKGSLQHRGHITELTEQSILHAKDNIEKYTPTKLLDLDVSVFLASTILLRNINNKFLTRKFISNFGKLVEQRLVKDIHNKEIRMELLDYFGIVGKDIEFVILPKEKFIKIRILDYLEIQGLVEDSPLSAPNLRLVNQVLEKGYVIIDIPKFVYLLRLALEVKLFHRISKEMKEYTEIDLINRCVKELQDSGKYPDNFMKPSKKGVIPQTIQDIIDTAYREKHLDHPSRIKLGIYMQAQGYPIEDILEVYKQCSDYSEKTTRYQLNSLKRYIKQ